MTEQARRTRRSAEEILNLVRQAKVLIEDGMPITPACDKVGIKYKTYINNYGRVRTNRHLYGNKFAQEAKQRQEIPTNTAPNNREFFELKEENEKLKTIITKLLLKEI